MSLDYLQTPDYHYQLARELQVLRERGVLIVGSGNMVHNLRLLDWRRMNSPFAFDWAEEASEKMKRFLQEGDHKRLINYRCHGKAFEQAIPRSEEHTSELQSRPHLVCR